MFLIRYLRERLIQKKVNLEADFYNTTSNELVLENQLFVFNAMWQNIQDNVPLYSSLVQKGKAPKNITTWDEFVKLPIISRNMATQNINSYTDSSLKPSGYGTTGGSTGNPLRFPKWSSEAKFCEPSIWYVRGFYGVKRSDKMFRIWGHSHTLGKGWKRIINKLIFDIGLPLVGFKRFSAYDLSDEKLIQAGDEILKFKPSYIIGYSKALFMLAKANEHRSTDFHALGLKVVMGAAEGFDKDEDRAFVAEVFGCPVGLQYASMEANYIAQTHPDGGYRVLWKNNLIECVDDEGNPAATGRILVTSLYPRAFPLIRYEMGDIIANCKKDGISVYEFENVKGRDNDFLMLDDGTPIHSEGITHAIKLSNQITAYQIRYTEDGVYTIYVTSNEKLPASEIQSIKNHLKQVDVRLADLDIVQTDRLKQTIAGKTKWFLPE